MHALSTHWTDFKAHGAHVPATVTSSNQRRFASQLNVPSFDNIDSMNIAGSQPTKINHAFASRDSKLDLSPEDTIARSELLSESVFPDWKDDTGGSDISNPDEMQKRDPLATQIWKLYSKTKSRLPNQERMENLTWRMMAMSMKRRENLQAKFVVPSYHVHKYPNEKPPSMRPSYTSTPSGIAQLRKSLDQTAATPSDPMNLDDFIVPNSFASPAGITPPPSDGNSLSESAMASAIPIKMRKEAQMSTPPPFPPPSSVPNPPHNDDRKTEFGYVQRRVRKTSVDERRVRDSVGSRL